MKDKLKAYFDEAAGQPPVLDQQDVERLLGRTVVVKKIKWFNPKFFITMMVLGACTIAVWLMIGNTENTLSPLQTRGTIEISPQNNVSPGISAQQKLPADAGLKDRGRISEELTAIEANEKYTIDHQETPKAGQPVYDISDTADLTPRVLSADQLEKLNIMIKNGVAYYDNRCRQNGKINSLEIVAKGNSLETKYNHHPFARFRLRRDDVPALPVAITSVTGIRPTYFYPSDDSQSPEQEYGQSRQKFEQEQHELVPVQFGEKNVLWFYSKDYNRILLPGTSNVEYDKVFPFNEYMPGWALVKKDGLSGFINKAGEEVVKPVYDEVYPFDEYKAGWALVKQKNKYGFVNNKGETIVPVIYDRIMPFDELYRGWAEVIRDGKKSFIDKNGDPVNPSAQQQAVPSENPLFSKEQVAQLQKQYINIKEEDLEKFDVFGSVAVTDYDLTRVNYVRNNLKTHITSDAVFIKEAEGLIALRPGDQKSMVIWFEPDEKLVEALTLSHGYTKPDLSGMKFLDLDAAELSKLGISQSKAGTRVPSIVTKKIISYGVYSRSGSEHEFTFKPREDTSLAIDFSTQANLVPHYDAAEDRGNLNEVSFPTPVLLTNASGLVWYMYSLPEDDSVPFGKTKDAVLIQERSKRNREKMMARLGSLIPVKVSIQEQYKDSRKHMDLLAWYEPDSLFLSVIPHDKAKQISTELAAITQEQTPSTCYYFDACGNRKGVIETFSVYPNPFDRNLGFAITLKEERRLTISLTDISGKLVETLWDQRECKEGANYLEYTLHNIPDGMYLLVIGSDKGERLVQRLVRKRE